MSFLGIGLPAFTELAGGLLGGALNSAYQRSQLASQAALMKDLWKYQMQNAHQFEVDDLRNAGLNPILSATNSQIASMPSVNTPTAAPYQGLANGLGNVVNNALKLDLEKRRLENETLKNKADISKIQAETIESGWKSMHYQKLTENLARDLFEKIDLYSLKKDILKANREQGWRMVDKIGAETFRLGTQAGLDIATTALKEKEYKFGSYIASWLPLAFSEDLEKDPSSAIAKWKKAIFDVIDEKGNELAPSAKSTWDDIKTFYHLGD